MLDPAPSKTRAFSSMKLLWASSPRKPIEWVFVTLSLVPLWGALIAATYGGLLAAPHSALGYVLLGGVAVIGLPIALSVTLPIIRPRERRVSLDLASSCICFENVFLHKGFRLPRRERSFSCPFQDILWAQFMPALRGPEWLVVSTTNGRIFLSSFSEDLAALHETLAPHARRSNPPFMQSAYLPAAIAGTIVAVGLIVAFAMGWLP